MPPPTRPPDAAHAAASGVSDRLRAAVTVALGVYLIGLVLALLGNGSSGASALVRTIKSRLYAPWLVPAWLDLGHDHHLTYGMPEDADHTLEVRATGDHKATPLRLPGRLTGERAARWRRLAAAGAPASEPPAAGDEDGPVPRYLRRRGRHWERWRDGRWQRLDLREAACHLSHHEALAWCAWAGRRLPTEHEWERAACTQPEAFAWGEVWEWTASPFRPYPGFAPHPYREYSAPWFDGRPVLRGASCLTQPRLRDARYRNYFTAGRHDVPAGFRTCARG